MKAVKAQEYTRKFRGKKAEAFKYALETRKFEIELYWKRATYFWTFIGAIFAGFFVAYASINSYRTDLLVILCCMGMVFSFAWFCVNKGSKFWQENWENHVDLLEESNVGPLFKIVISRDYDSKWRMFKSYFTGPGPYSVSKINQLISLFVFILWCSLLVKVVPINVNADFNAFYCFVISLSVICCVFFSLLGRTHNKEHVHEANLRSSSIRD